MDNCIFCKIIKGEIKNEFLYEDNDFIVINDKYPKAPYHFLIITKNHFEDINFISDDMWIKVKKIALELSQKHNLKGFRLVNNSGLQAEIKHFHVHLLAKFSVSEEVSAGMN